MQYFCPLLAANRNFFPQHGQMYSLTDFLAI